MNKGFTDFYKYMQLISFQEVSKVTDGTAHRVAKPGMAFFAPNSLYVLINWLTCL